MTTEKMMSIALGQLGWNYEQFFKATFFEFFAAWHGFQILENSRRKFTLEIEKQKMQTAWEISRWQIFKSVHSPDVKKLFDVARFEWDEDPARDKEKTEQQRKAFAKTKQRYLKNKAEKLKQNGINR